MSNKCSKLTHSTPCDKMYLDVCLLVVVVIEDAAISDQGGVANIVVL